MEEKDDGLMVMLNVHMHVCALLGAVHVCAVLSAWLFNIPSVPQSYELCIGVWSQA